VRTPRLWIAVALVVVATVVTSTLVFLVRDGDQQTSTHEESAPSISQPPAVTDASIAGLPLRGRPLELDTGLRLLIADAPAPFVFDVDRGTARRITGLPRGGKRGVSVLAVGENALILSTRFCNRCHSTSAYLLRHGSTAATSLGKALQVIPARDGESVWMLRRGPGHCLLERVTLDGQRRGAPRTTSCRVGLVGDLPAGLLTTFVGSSGMNAHDDLLRPDGKVIRFGDESARPVVRNLLLSGADPRTPFVLRDVSTGATRILRRPSRPSYSLGQITGQANGQLATINFARYSPVDRYDLWLLDTQTGRWRHVPGMPAHAIPKVTYVQWTRDGRVLILAANALGVWRPGDAHLAVRRVPEPKQPGVQFVVW
jgi:hypothetical protein